MNRVIKYLSWKLVTLLIVVVFFVFTYQQLFFIINNFFNFHDNTQAGRIVQYAKNIQMGIFPAHIAFDMSFGLGHPMLSLYAPLSYIVGSVIFIFSRDIILSLATTWILPLILSTFFLLKLLALLTITQNKQLQKIFLLTTATACILFFTNNYIALDIFVRGNLAEIWFLAFFVITNYLFLSMRWGKSNWKLILSFLGLLLAHNALSPISLVYFLILTSFHPLRRRIFYSLLAASGLSAFFYWPLFLEASLTHAKEIALKTYYADHFLCFSQLVNDNLGWRFGASMPGCTDGMVFALSKANWLAIGIIIFGLVLFSSKNWKKISQKFSMNFTSIFILVQFITLIIAIFMTLDMSKIIWDTFQNQIALMQFPWRFLVFLPLPIAILYQHMMNFLSINFDKKLIIGINIFILLLSLTGIDNFRAVPLSRTEFEQNFASPAYISKSLVYSYLELTPKQVDIPNYLSYHPSMLKNPPIDAQLPANGDKIRIIQNTPLKKIIQFPSTSQVYINVHNFPNWRYIVNGHPWYPTTFDKFARPIWESQTPVFDVEFQIIYSQSKVQKIGVLISVLTFLILLILTFVPLLPICRKCLLTLRQN